MFLLLKGLIGIEGVIIEGVVHCTDCKAPLGKFVILGHINNGDLTVCHLFLDFRWRNFVDGNFLPFYSKKRVNIGLLLID